MQSFGLSVHRHVHVHCSAMYANPLIPVLTDNGMRCSYVKNQQMRCSYVKNQQIKQGITIFSIFSIINVIILRIKTVTHMNVPVCLSKCTYLGMFSLQQYNPDGPAL